MSITKAAGILIIIVGVIYLLVGIVNMGPTWSAAPGVVDKSDVYGLNMDSTNVRFKIGAQLGLEIVICLVLGLIGWWLNTQEVRQLWYVYMLTLFIIASVVIRGSPMIGITTAKLSPAMAFYGAAVQFDSMGDTTAGWVTIPVNQSYRVGVFGLYKDASQMGSTEVVLDFSGNTSAMQQFVSGGGRAKITGRVMGTRVIALKNQVFIAPLVSVERVG